MTPSPARPRRHYRLAAVGAALVTAAGAGLWPVASDAVTPPLQCGVASSSRPWQSLPVPSFPGVQNVPTTDTLKTYSVDRTAAFRVLATNGTTLQASTTDGCSWQRVLTLEATPATPGGPSGATAHITATVLLPGGRGVLALQDGSGAASRPRILSAADGTGGGYAPTESGLPQQGTPGALAAANDGHTVYLSVLPTGGSGPGGGPGPLPVPLPSLPPNPVGGGGTPGSSPGLLYASTDGGVTWTQRTSATGLAANQRDITQLAVDPSDANRLFAVADGALLRSTDGGATFTSVKADGMGQVRAVATGGPGEAAFIGTGGAFLLVGQSAYRFTALPGTAIAFRGPDSLAVETGGQLAVLDARTGGLSTSGTQDEPGSLSGDHSDQATFHAIAGHRLLRYADAVASGGTVGPAGHVHGDVPPTPPRQGVLSPAGLQVVLAPGASRAVTYQLALPDDPTPLNIFYLVDVSSTLTDYQNDLKRNIGRISQALAARRISLRVGIGTIGTGPSDGKPPYPDTSAPDPAANPQRPYKKPTLYHLLRRLGPPDGQFYDAVNQLQTETLPYPSQIYGKNNDAEEGQLLSLEQLVTGSGVLSQQSSGPLPQYTVPGGQDAGFVPDPFVRNVVVTATDEYFANPTGSPRVPSGELDFGRVISELKAQRVQALGLTIGTDASEPLGSYNDLARVATGTGAIAPAGGIQCSAGEIIPAGKPIVCTQPENFSQLLVSVLSGLRDIQALSVVHSSPVHVITAVQAPALASVDVARAHTLPFTVTFSCAGLNPGSYPVSVKTMLRGYAVGAVTATVQCLAPPGPVLRRPQAPFLPPPPAQPGLTVVPAVPPPPPPAQPQVPPQAQAQTQINPVSAAAVQEEQQLQLALALSADLPEPETELAMVNRRRGEERDAVALLAAAMLATSVGAAVRLRIRPATGLARARNR